MSGSSPQKKQWLSLSLSKQKRSSTERFTACSDEDLEAAARKAIPKNTMIAVNWAVKTLQDYSASTSHGYAAEDLWRGDQPEKVCAMLSRFCMEVKKQNGSPYTPKSLLQLLVNLQNNARSINQHCFNFMNAKDVRFTQIHNVLDNLARSLHKQGVGAKKKQARVVTLAEEEELWHTGVMGWETPQAL